MSKILVIGSSNIDMTAKVERLPRPGETIGNAVFMQANGGKGANQAVAAARLGGDVTFVTCVGKDANGDMLKKQFTTEKIHTDYMITAKDAPTGTALIFVAADGENCIAVAPSANNCILRNNIDAIKNVIDETDYILLQLEIPIDTVEYIVEYASKKGKKIILNPAPAAKVSDELLNKLYLITPNETESGIIAGMQVENPEEILKAAEVLMKKGVENVIITLGSKGSLLVNSTGKKMFEARKVQAIDTTAAGDVYNGALVAALAEGKTLEDAIRFATISSSISVTRMGAQTSVPYRQEVDSLL